MRIGNGAPIVECPSCGPQPARPWTRLGEWTVVSCARCGLRITWPRPGPEVLARVYAENAYYEDTGMGASAAADWPERARGILGLIPADVRSVLDLGAGEGHLVAALKAVGVEADGIEPSPAGRQAARQIHGLDLGTRLAEAPRKAYDLVTLVHSLEHVPDPPASLADASAVLRPGGHLFIEVPHADSVELWRPARRRQLLCLPVHLYHFTPETLAPIVRRSGLEIVGLHLYNPDALEWVLSLRGRAAVPSAPAAAPASAKAGPPPDPGPPRLWRDRVLPWVRRRFPGWKFQVVARRSGG
jgi:SAM-dependent methyltransferase